jgi:cytochrome c553
MLFRYLFPLLLVTFSFGVAAETLQPCPVAPATEWRKALKESDLEKQVRSRHDGSWSAYIARWERQIDTARDVHSRNKGLIVRFGKKRQTLRNENLLQYIAGMEQRVVTAYCLGKRQNLARDISETEGLGVAAMDKRRVSGQLLSVLVGCPRCHGENGVSEKREIPNLAGQQFGYLVNQLRSFKEDHAISTYPFGSAMRNEKAMADWVRLLTPENKLNLAVHYSSLPCEIEGSSEKTTLQRPLIAQVCLGCHENEGSGNSSVVPRINGQKKDYIVSELRAFRMTKGDTKSFKFNNRRFHQYMSAIAAPLTNEDMTELAAWFSSRSCKAR